MRVGIGCGPHLPAHPARRGPQEHGRAQGVRGAARPAAPTSGRSFTRRASSTATTRRGRARRRGRLRPLPPRARDRLPRGQGRRHRVPARRVVPARAAAASASACATRSARRSTIATRLQRKIDEVDGWKDRELFLVHALAFPDISVHKLVLAPDAPPRDRRSTATTSGHRARRSSACSPTTRDRATSESRPGPRARRCCESCSRRRSASRCRWRRCFDEEERQLVELTDEQAALLNRFGRDRRMVVTGCAGSGKTMLAIERARQLAAAGREVLFVCFNKALCDAPAGVAKVDGLDFFTFHGLCTRLAQRRPRSRCRSTRATRRRSSGRRRAARRARRRDREPRRPVRRHPRRRGAGPALGLAGRADMHAARRAARARSGCSWTTTSASTTRRSTCPTSTGRSTSPSTAATRRRSTAR